MISIVSTKQVLLVFFFNELLLSIIFVFLLLLIKWNNFGQVQGFITSPIITDTQTNTE